MRHAKSKSMWGLMLAAVMVLAACSSTAPAATPAPSSPAATADESPQMGGTLRVVTSWYPRSLDPARSTSGYDHNFLFLLYDTLVGISPDMKPIPSLATKWESPNDLTYIFHLRNDVVLHDGTKFDAEVVKWNFERHMNPDSNSVNSGDFIHVSSIEVVDPYTVKLNLKQPQSQLLLLLADRGGMIVSPKAVQQYGADYGVKYAVGSGPYRLVENAPDRRVVMTANQEYWAGANGPPYLDGITFMLVPDDSTHIVMLQAGETDMVFQVPPQDAQKVRTTSNLTLHSSFGNATDMIYLNPTRGPITDVRVRQAMNYAIDRDQLVKTLYFGEATPAATLIAPTLAVHNKNVKPYPYDPAKAKQLLKEAGFENGVTVDMILGSQPFRIRGTQIVEAMLADVGISLNKSILEPAVSSNRTGTADYTSMFSVWTGRSSGHLTLTLMYSRQSGYGGPRNHHKDTERLQTLISSIDAEYDAQKQQVMWNETQELLHDRALDIPLAHPNLLIATTDKVRFTVFGDSKLHLQDAWLTK